MIRVRVHERVAMSVSGHKTWSVFDRYNITAEDDIRQALARTQKYWEEAIRELSNDTPSGPSFSDKVTLKVAVQILPPLCASKLLIFPNGA